MALLAGGCSFSYKLDSMFSKAAPPDPADVTGSIRPRDAELAKSANLLADMDLAYAKEAASDLLARGGSDQSLPWENPTTGARGTVTPIASAYESEGFTCRDFLASYVRDGNEAWMQGEACRVHEGRWEVRNLKPWRRS